jgi:hypothetical protein
MDRQKVIKTLRTHKDEEAQLEVSINKERNPNKAYKLNARLYRVKAIIARLMDIVRKLPHNKGEHEFDSSNPNYDKIDYDKFNKN